MIQTEQWYLHLNPAEGQGQVDDGGTLKASISFLSSPGLILLSLIYDRLRYDIQVRGEYLQSQSNTGRNNIEDDLQG